MTEAARAVNLTNTLDVREEWVGDNEIGLQAEAHVAPAHHQGTPHAAL